MNTVLKVFVILYLASSVVLFVCAVVSYFDFRFPGVSKKEEVK